MRCLKVLFSKVLKLAQQNDYSKYVEMNIAHPFMKGIDYSYYYEENE